MCGRGLSADMKKATNHTTTENVYAFIKTIDENRNNKIEVSENNECLWQTFKSEQTIEKHSIIPVKQSSHS